MWICQRSRDRIRHGDVNDARRALYAVDEYGDERLARREIPDGQRSERVGGPIRSRQERGLAGFQTAQLNQGIGGCGILPVTAGGFGRSTKTYARDGERIAQIQGGRGGGDLWTR